MLERRKEPSQRKFRELIDLIPKDQRIYPIIFSPRELEYLEGSLIKGRIEEEQDTFRKRYVAIRDRLADFEQFKFHEFCQVMQQTYSRVFWLEINGE